MSVCEVDGHLIKTEGVGECYMRDPHSASFRCVRVIITTEGSNFLLGLSDLKNLQLLDPQFPHFLGTGSERRKPKDVPPIPQPTSHQEVDSPE